MNLTGFAVALIATEKSPFIPDEDNYFGPMIGEWDIEWVESAGTPKERRVQGEWMFSWVLEGTAVQDVFICPSRATRVVNPQPDPEYGTTLHIYNPDTHYWDVFYGCAGEATRLEARQIGEEIVMTETATHSMKWVFSDITDNRFRWRRMERWGGGGWRTVGEAFARRRGGGRSG